MRFKLRTLVGAAVIGLAAQATAQVTFYEGDGFGGRSFTVDNVVPNFAPLGFNDRARSAIVEHGRWEVCEDAGFQGRCVILRPGRYDLSGIDMYRRISSVRPVESYGRYNAPEPQPLASSSYEYYQRPSEPLYEAPVTSVRAVVGPPEQRCWVERQQVYEDNRPNVPGAIVGAVIGGVLGHQVGGGRGRDVATAGGAVAGAAIGSNVGRGGGGTYDRDVQRCENVSSDMRPDYWDVTYNFRGIEHRVQLSTPPGPTIAVNADGEPRG